MNFERINEYLRESSNQSRFVLALSLSTVMALAVAAPLAIQANGINQKATEKVIDLEGPSPALLDREGNMVLVPQAAILPLSDSVASPQNSSTPPATVQQPTRTNPAAPTASPTQAPPTTIDTGSSITVPVSTTEPETDSTTGSSVTKETPTTKDNKEPTTTEDVTTTSDKNDDTETTIDTSTSVAPEPTLSNPPPQTTAAATKTKANPASTN